MGFFWVFRFVLMAKVKYLGQFFWDMAGSRVIGLVFLIALMALLPNAYAATVYGKIYDLSLAKAPGAKVAINTTPEQFMISEDGSYSFEVQNGFYTINAEQDNGIRAYETRNISINQDGKYVIDLILFPSFQEEEEIADEEGIAIPEFKDIRFVPLMVILFLIIIAIILFAVFRSRSPRYKKNALEPKADDDHSIKDDYNPEMIIGLIKKEGGRLTQKEIRKKIPFSEAKISLMIAELEHKGLIEKIKKGRGNIIILKK